MTAEQLEELLGKGRDPDCEHCGRDDDLLVSLARRVLAAEKLVAALMVALEPFAQQADTFDSDGVEYVPDQFEPAIVGHTIGDLRRARTTYREANQ